MGLQVHRAIIKLEINSQTKLCCRHTKVQPMIKESDENISILLTLNILEFELY